MNVWLAPLVALTVGFVTALLTGIQLIVGKENKVSEFRQDWINEQRKDLAAALAAAQAYLDFEKDARIEQMAVFDAAQARVELRENPKVEEWIKVRAALVKLRAEMVGDKLNDANLLMFRDDIYRCAHPSLKANWTVVKDGETFFRIFKYVYAVLICVFIVVAVIWMLTTVMPSAKAPSPAPTPSPTRTATKDAASPMPTQAITSKIRPGP